MYLLDTNICIYIRRERPPKVAERFRSISPDALAMSSITFAELVYGARKSQAVAPNLERLLVLRGMIRVLPFDDAAADAYGSIRTELERRGELIGRLQRSADCRACAQSGGDAGDQQPRRISARCRLAS
ncbi:MAG: PIN domain-containing protein [Sulfuritalea sp.]|nr:PIN domain-containing protein [Sulfuritalea sp.]